MLKDTKKNTKSKNSNNLSKEDQKVLAVATKILKEHKKAFEVLGNE